MHPGGGNPFKPSRTQDDGLGDIVSEMTAHTPTGEHLTRQEFKDDADINILLARFGVDQQMRQPAYGQTIDYSIDLQTAMGAISDAQRVAANVPEELRQKYPTWREILNASETGQYQHDLNELSVKKAETKRQAAEEAERKKAAEAAKSDPPPKA